MEAEQKQPADALGSSEGLGPESGRAAFEAHMDGLQYNLRRHAERPHQYANTAVQGRWVSWQAAVAAERERCAALCDSETVIQHGEFGAGWVQGAKACADLIRDA